LYPFSEEFRASALPILEGGDGRIALQDGLREVAVVEVAIAQGSRLQVLADLEAVAVKDALDATIEPLDPAVRVRPHWEREAVLDAKLCAEQVGLVLCGGDAFAQSEQPVGKSPSAVGQHPGDLCARRPISLLCRWPRKGSGAYLRWPSGAGISHIDMQVAGLTVLEGPCAAVGMVRAILAEMRCSRRRDVGEVVSAVGEPLSSSRAGKTVARFLACDAGTGRALQCGASRAKGR
jgi:hypothetical protein